MRTLMIDTRQQKDKHNLKDEYFAKAGIVTLRSKLPVGDYTWVQDMSVVVDSKRDIQEVVGNLVQDHERFRAEAQLAKDSGIKFYVLIETTEPIYCLDDIRHWSNPRLHRYNKIRYMHQLGKWTNVKLPKRPTDNITLMKIMWTMQDKYDVNWVFSTPEDAGAKIIELLGGIDGKG